MALKNDFFQKSLYFYFSFSLTKKKQKFKAIRQPPLAPQNLPGMAVRSELPKPAALLPTYELVLIFVTIFISLKCIVLQNDLLSEC